MFVQQLIASCVIVICVAIFTCLLDAEHAQKVFTNGAQVAQMASSSQAPASSAAMPDVQHCLLVGLQSLWMTTALLHLVSQQMSGHLQQSCCNA